MLANRLQRNRSQNMRLKHNTRLRHSRMIIPRHSRNSSHDNRRTQHNRQGGRLHRHLTQHTTICRNNLLRFRQRLPRRNNRIPRARQGTRQRNKSSRHLMNIRPIRPLGAQMITTRRLRRQGRRNSTKRRQTNSSSTRRSTLHNRPRPNRHMHNRGTRRRYRRNNTNQRSSTIRSHHTRRILQHRRHRMILRQHQIKRGVYTTTINQRARQQRSRPMRQRSTMSSSRHSTNRAHSNTHPMLTTTLKLIRLDRFNHNRIYLYDTRSTTLPRIAIILTDLTLLPTTLTTTF